jgi:autotransporter-associated beta strand protein
MERCATSAATILVNAASQTFDNDFVIGGQGWNESSGLLGALRLNSTTLTGDITITSNSRITSAGSSTLSGVISGDYNLDFFEDSVIGTISLSGANTYTGTTIVNSMGGGTTFPSLLVSNNSALGTTAGGTIVHGTGTSGNGSQLTLANGITVTDETLTLDPTANGYRASLITAADATATWDGNVVIAGTGGTLAFHASGATSNLTVGSSEGDTITGANSLMVRGTGSGTVNSTIAVGTGNLFKTDGGTWTIASNNNSYTGATQAASGVLSIGTIANSGVNCAIGAGNSILLGQNSATAGVLRFTGASGGASNRALPLANGATGGAGTIENAVAGQTLTLSGALTVNAPGNACTLTLTGAGDGVMSGGLVGTPAMSLSKTGAGSWTLSGSYNHTGATSVTGGVLTLDANCVVNAAGAVGTFTVNGSNAVANIAGTYNVGNGNANAYFEIRGGGTLNFSGNSTLANAPTGGGIRVGEAGAGTLVANTTSFRIGGNAGSASATVNLNTGGTQQLGVSVSSLGTSRVLNFDGGTLRAGSDITVAGLTEANIKDGGAVFDSNGSTLVVNQALLNGAGATTATLTKNGSGILRLTAANTYAGATTVTAGTLELVGGSQASAITVNPGASLGFILGSPTTSTNAFNLSAGTIKITGTPTLASYDLITSSTAITGTPVLDAPISGYELKVDGSSLKLVKAGYASWAAINAIGSAPNLDKDSDGVTNAVEYVLGGTVVTNDLDKLPTVDASGANLVFTFKRDRESIDGSTTLAIEVGNTLAGWPAVFSVGTTTGNSSAGVTVAENSPAGFDTITLTVAKGGDETKFGRLKVTVVE